MAITHNVKYLADIHRKNNNELSETKDYLAFVVKEKDRLEDANEELTKLVGNLQKDQKELAKQREKMSEMVIESQANKEEIKKLQEETIN